MHIITTYFKVKNIPGTINLGKSGVSSSALHLQRQDEYLYCLSKMTQHRGVKKVHLLVEGQSSLDHFHSHVREPSGAAPSTTTSTSFVRHKLIPLLRTSAMMPVYGDFFQYANQMLQNQLVMVCNADVYPSLTKFDVQHVADLFQLCEQRVTALREMTPKGDEDARPTWPLALALTRHESEQRMDAPFIERYRGSHDAFIVRPPLPLSLIQRLGHPQNCYQAENIVIHELKQHGFLVLNPCLDLHLTHVHAADVRQWFPSVDPKRYGLAPPCTMKECRHITSLSLYPSGSTEL